MRYGTNPHSLSGKIPDAEGKQVNTGKALTDDELNQVIVAALADRNSRGEIDAEERAAINETFNDLPNTGVDMDPVHKFEADPDRKATSYAQYVYDSLKAAGTL
jgi:hypothetical protein